MTPPTRRLEVEPSWVYGGFLERASPSESMRRIGSGRKTKEMARYVTRCEAASLENVGEGVWLRGAAVLLTCYVEKHFQGGVPCSLQGPCQCANLVNENASQGLQPSPTTNSHHPPYH